MPSANIKYKTFKSHLLSGTNIEIPDHWAEKRLKYLVTHNDESLDDDYDPDTVIRYVDISSVDRTKGIVNVEELSFNKAPSRARRIVKAGDTIVSTVRTYLKAIASIDEKSDGFIVSTGFVVLRPIESEMDSRFLGYVINDERLIGEIVANSNGVTYPAINPSALVDLRVFQPPLSEQKSIANFLDQKTKQIDDLIEQKEKLLQLLTEKRTAIITQAVTKGLNPKAKMKDSGLPNVGDIPHQWSIKQMKRICSIFGRIGFRGYTLADYVPEGEGAVSISPGNIEDNRIDLGKCTYISWDKYHESPEIKVFEGDIVLVKTGSTIGKVAHVQSVPKPMTINPQLAIFKDIKVDRRFLYYALTSDYFQNELIRSISGGATPALTQENIGVIHLILPTDEEQLEIAKYLDRIVNHIITVSDEIQKSILALSEYKSALITSAVTGQIDVQKKS